MKGKLIIPIRMRPEKPICFSAIAASLVMVLAGCQSSPNSTQPTPTPEQKKDAQDVEKIRKMSEANVVGIVPLWDPFSPWIWNNDRTRAVGICTKQFYLI